MNEQPGGDMPELEDLVEAFLRRYRRGEKPSIQDYAQTYPEWAAEIRELLSAVMLVEDYAQR